MIHASLAGPGPCVLAVAVSLALAAGLATAAPAAGPGDPPLLRLQHDVFDPLRRPAAVPDAFATTMDAGAAAVHVVQFHGPIDAAAHAAVRRSGLTVLGYVPDFALLVRGDDARVQALATDPLVRWTGAWSPAFRLHPQLLARAGRGDPDRRQLVDIALFQDAAPAALRQLLQQHALRVPADGGADGDSRVLRLEVPDGLLATLARRPEVAWIAPHQPARRANAAGRQIVGKDHIESVLGLHGDGQVVGVGDDGLSTGDLDTLHPDFDGRVIGTTSTGGGGWGFGFASEHGTHVAGTVLGSGLLDGAVPAQHAYTGTHAGIAPEAQLFMWALCPCSDVLNVPSDLYNNYLQPQYAFDPRLRVSNNSWGNSANFYTEHARRIDHFVSDHPDMVVVVAAGNDGSDPGTVGSPSTAKNILAVGSVVTVAADDPTHAVSWFSSRGPVLDGRLKPDVVAPGHSLWSTTSALPDSHAYTQMAGTSMASPVVSGAAAIVREYLQKHEGVPVPSAALVKAMLINGAQDVAGGEIRLPDMAQGWGRIDLRESLLHENGRSLWYYEHPGIATGETFSATLALADTGFPVRATLVWSDAPAMGVSATHLVNDLDLQVGGPSGGGTAVYTGNDRLGDALLDLDTDRLNNVEGVDAEAPDTGNWTLTVTAHNVPEGPQPFALVASGGFGPWSALTLDVTPDAASACAGSTAEDLFAVQVRRHRSDLTEPVTLAAAGLPGTIASSFSANAVPADFDSSLSLALDRSVPGASYALTLQADAGAVGTLVGATLTVLPLPASPTLVAPAAAANNVPPSSQLEWVAAADADDGYRVELALDPAFTQPVHTATVPTPALALPPGLDLSTTYHWRVTALNGCGETPSKVRGFTMAGEPIFADDFEDS